MALQSSFKRQPERLPTRYWVLPCCPFSFWGKFQREKFNSANSSRYFEYLRFVDCWGNWTELRVSSGRRQDANPFHKTDMFCRFYSTKERVRVGRIVEGKIQNDSFEQRRRGRNQVPTSFRSRTYPQLYTS